MYGHGTPVPDWETYHQWFMDQEKKKRLRPEAIFIFREQYLAPQHTATASQIAQLAGIKGGHPVVNRYYGRLGRRFCEDTNFRPELRPEDSTKRWWTVWSTGRYTETKEFLWTLHEPVVKAIELLGWADSLPESVFWEMQTNQIILSRKSSEEERLKRISQAPVFPEKIRVSGTEYKRNSDIVESALCNAQGKCAICNSPAPFCRDDNTPYLEVHHITPLSENGEDSLRNVVVLCPNCHREIHYGKKNEKHRILDDISKQRK